MFLLKDQEQILVLAEQALKRINPFVKTREVKNGRLNS
jgi:hypothetical protein